MNRKLIFFLVALIFFSNPGFAQQGYKKTVKLAKDCSYNNRKPVNAVKNKIALLSTENDFYILTIKDRKYMPCNLPAGIKSKSIMISGSVLETFPNERLMATPLKLTKASLK